MNYHIVPLKTIKTFKVTAILLIVLIFVSPFAPLQNASALASVVQIKSAKSSDGSDIPNGGTVKIPHGQSKVKVTFEYRGFDDNDHVLELRCSWDGINYLKSNCSSESAESRTTFTGPDGVERAYYVKTGTASRELQAPPVPRTYTFGVKVLNDNNSLSPAATWTFRMGASTTNSDVKVESVFPSNGFKSPRGPAYITVRFSDPVLDSSVTSSTFMLKSSSGQEIKGIVTMNRYDGNHDPSYAKFIPQGPLEDDDTYTAKLDGIKDLAGNSLSPYEWSFTILNNELNKNKNTETNQESDGSQVAPPPPEVQGSGTTDGTKLCNGTKSLVDLWEPCQRRDPRDHRTHCSDIKSHTKDSDADGFTDYQEVCGIDINKDGLIDLDLHVMGASPSVKDIFVEVDYMQFHKPNQGAINDVIKSFANAPNTNANRDHRLPSIQLHVQVNEMIPHKDEITFNEVAGDLKNMYFGTEDERHSPNSKNILAAKKALFHYAIFGHNGGSCGGCIGQGSLGGKDFMIVLGDSHLARDTNNHPVGNRDQQAGTFMHELGHNLGLDHGGYNSVNNKPNYMSVMNYLYHMPSLVGDWHGDYSRCEGTILNENDLDEERGIHVRCGLGKSTFVYGIGVVKTDTPIDYNGDGDTNDSNIEKDLNNDHIPNPSPIIRPPSFIKYSLSGNDDWSYIMSHLHYNLASKSDSDLSLDNEVSFPVPREEFSVKDLLNHRLLLLDGIRDKINKLPSTAFREPQTAAQMKNTLKAELTKIASPTNGTSALLTTANLNPAIEKLSSLKNKVDSSMERSAAFKSTTEEESRPLQEVRFLIDNLIKVLERQK